MEKLNVVENGTVIHGFSGGDWERIIGKVMGIVDTLGLQERQHTAFRKLVMNELWDAWNFAIFTSVEDSKKYGGTTDQMGQTSN